jgi:uncharacterized FlaG/YvyC family protein
MERVSAVETPQSRRYVMMNINGIGSAATTAAPVYNGAERPATAAHHSDASPATVATTADAAVKNDAEFEKLMEEPIKQANKSLIGYDRQIEREIHEVTKALMYKIRDTKTNEVIAEYPPKKIQDMIAKMWELAGLFIDQKA